MARMSTGIEWTDKTWNPTTGCTKVSVGCKNCDAMKMTKRLVNRLKDFQAVAARYEQCRHNFLTVILGVYAVLCL